MTLVTRADGTRVHQTSDACASKNYHVAKTTLHDLVLCQATSVLGTFHSIAAVAHVGVLDVGKTQGPATVLVSSELGYACVSDEKTKSTDKLTDRGLSICSLLKLDHTGSARATVGLVLDLGTLDLANRSEELDEVLVASRPGKIANVDGVAGLAACSSVICEWVRRGRSSVGVESRAARSTAKATSTTVASATSKATTKSATATKASTTAEATSEATASAESATTTKATRSASKSVFAYL
jgi:hypothetical protein